MAKKMMSNMMEEVFNSMLQETAKAGELERKIIEDKLFFGDVTDSADDFADADVYDVADDAADDFADLGDYLDFRFSDAKIKRSKRFNQKKNTKERIQEQYLMCRPVRYAHRFLFDSFEKTGTCPVFHGQESPVTFIKKSGRFDASLKKLYKKVTNRKIRYNDRKAVTDYFNNEDMYDHGVIAEFYRKNRATIEEVFVSMKVAEEPKTPLMTKISELSEEIHEYNAWLTAQIMVRQFDIAWFDSEIEALEIRREETMKELRDLLG